MPFDDLLLDPIYDSLGTRVQILGTESSETEASAVFDGLVIDKTAGVEISESSGRRGAGMGAVSLPTVVPVMAVRFKDLAAQSLQPGDLVGLSVTLNGSQWTIVNHIPRPGIAGEPGGQVYYRMRRTFDGPT